jgi:hypothetical protein
MILQVQVHLYMNQPSASSNNSVYQNYLAHTRNAQMRTMQYSNPKSFYKNT